MLARQIFRYGLIVFTLGWLASGHYRPWVNFSAELLAFTGICALVATCFLAKGWTLVVPKTYGWIFIAIAIPWIQFAAGISPFVGDAFISSFYVAGLLGALFVGYSFGTYDHASDSCLSGFMYGLWSAALFSAFVGFLQWLELEGVLGIFAVERSTDGRAMGNLGQANQLATLLLIGVVAFAFTYEKYLIGRLTFYLGITFLSFVLILTQSRTGSLSVIVMGAFLIWKHRKIKLRLSGLAVIIWIALFYIATFLFPYLNSALLLGQTRELTAHASINERYLLWEQVLYAISQSPWVGYGWNQTATAQTVGAMIFPGSTPFTYAHNFALDMVAWNGIPLGVVLTAVCGYWLITRLKRVVEREAVFAMAGLLPIIVHSMLEYPFAYSYFLLTAGLMAGVVEASMRCSKTIRLNMRWCWSVFLLYIAIGGYLSYEYLLVEEDYRVARFEMLRVGTSPAGYQPPTILLNTHLAALLKATRQAVGQNMSSEDIDNMRLVALRFPQGPSTFRYALSLGLNGDPESASRLMILVRGLYGEKYYQAAKRQLIALKQERYPELETVLIP